MLVLGLNGWGRRSHDPAACLIADGQIVAFAEEERFTRYKHGFDSLPVHAARYCLDAVGVGLADVDAVTFGWDVPRLVSARAILPEHISSELEHFLPRKLFPRRSEPRFEFVDHHLAHAASALLYAEASSAAVLVIDGQGEEASATAYHGRDGKLTRLRTYPIGWSLGFFYEAACSYTGMRTYDAGKLMGLAAHGQPTDALDGLVRITADGYEFPHMATDHVRLGHSDDQEPIIAAWMQHFARSFSLPPNRLGSGTDVYAYRDVAATVQYVLEEAVLTMARDVLRTTGERVLALAGGIGFNATLNGKLRQLPEIDRLFVQPVAGDAGVALGSAALIAAESGDRISTLGGSLALGPEFNADAIRQALDEAGVRYSEPADIVGATADRITTGGLVGWFQGRAEVGPRALGSRSLLALPTERETRDRVNLQAKRREAWRPLAPSMQTEHASEILGEQLHLPYMVVTTRVTDSFRPLLGAVVHEDGTTRPQTVDAATHPLYHNLLGLLPHGIALNTSFNGRDEPIVATPAQALASSRELGLDALIIGPFLAELTDASEDSSWN
ncbi:carbamoyl transferase [Planomonospora sphaerica]|uniref:Carbamoyl transferase n=1 Tax=Planomonospora sphaerica TaxID=161355 RepID=A0A171DIQ2_9ACTN|nr:carbamoyltransferase C-terminal domain-containing protein [Planomonospora sphaerica]GAT68768.1 carbamoyl transferase [Planomonospora sphaerica]